MLNHLSEISVSLGVMSLPLKSLSSSLCTSLFLFFSILCRSADEPTNNACLILAVVLFGTSFGFLWLATVPATNGIVAQIFGTKNLTLLFGIVFLNHQFGSFLGAYLGGYFYDKFGSFDYAWYLAIVLSFIATALHLPIDERPIQKSQATTWGCNLSLF